MTYRVIQRFVDLQDNKHKYEVGDVFPHQGLIVSETRIEELSTNKNRRGIPLIEAVISKSEKPKNNKAKSKPKSKTGKGKK